MLGNSVSRDEFDLAVHSPLPPIHPFSFFEAVKNSFGSLFLLALFCLLINGVFSYVLNYQYKTQQEAMVRSELGTIRTKLEEKLNTNLFLVYGMAANISVKPDFSSTEFDALADELLSQRSILTNMAAAPKFIIRYIYPFKGNEAALGLNYRKVPDQWEVAYQAKLTGHMSVAGPIHLVQGGTGLIAHVPVIRQGNGEFWGIVSAVMSLDSLLEESGVTKALTTRLSIRGRDGKGTEGDVFWGNSALFVEGVNAIRQPVSLPYGAWEIAGQPKGGWQKSSPYQFWIHLISFLTFIAFGYLILVRKWEQELVYESERRLNAMSDASLEALVMTDANGEICFWNGAAETLFGYTRNEALGQIFHSLVMPPEDAKKLGYKLQPLAKGRHEVSNTPTEMRVLNQARQELIIEKTVASFQIGKAWYAVTCARDITARKAIEKRLKELATTDELTGLANRRCLMELAESQIKVALRYQQKMSLMMFDIDHFKAVNDNYGHAMGDQVLQQFSQQAMAMLRKTDRLGRIGGEEFLIVMPETELVDAFEVAERLRQHIESQTFSLNGDSLKVTVSAGISELLIEGDTLSALLSRVDSALYKAKHAGRNQVQCG